MCSRNAHGNLLSETSMSSSNCPPQLHLSLPANATSFKRSFEQFGFDLESPSLPESGGSSASGSLSLSGASSSSDGNDRNKRARSASSSSTSDQSIEMADRSAASGGTSSSGHDPEGSGLSATRRPLVFNVAGSQAYAVNSFLEPPRLPTPELPDVEMIDYQTEEASGPLQPPTLPPTILEPNERLRISLDRFNAFDSQISILRQSHSRSPPAVQSPSPPPTLPPLTISSSLDDRDRLNTVASPFPIPPTDPPPPLPEAFYSFGSSRSHTSSHDTPVRESFEAMLPHEMHGSESNGLRDRSPSFSSFRPFFPTPPVVMNNRPSTPPFMHRIENPRVIRPRPSIPRSSQHRDDHTSFRDRLDSAFDILRSHSPLFSDFNEQPLPSRTENTGPAALPRMRTQLDEDHSWGVPWFTHPSSNPRDLFTQAGDQFGPSRGFTSASAPYVSSGSRMDHRRDTSPSVQTSRNGLMRRISLDDHTHDTVHVTPDSVRPVTSIPAANFDRMRHGADAFLEEPGDEAEALSSHMNVLGRGSMTRTSSRDDPSSNIARFIAHGLLDPNEETRRLSADVPLDDEDTTRFRAEGHRLGGTRRLSTMRSTDDDLWGDRDTFDSEQLHRRSQAMLYGFPRRASSNYDVREGVRGNVDTAGFRRPLNYGHRQSSSSDSTRLRWTSSIPDLSSGQSHPPSRYSPRTLFPDTTPLHHVENQPRPSSNRSSGANEVDSENATAFRPTAASLMIDRLERERNDALLLSDEEDQSRSASAENATVFRPTAASLMIDQLERERNNALLLSEEDRSRSASAENATVFRPTAASRMIDRLERQRNNALFSSDDGDQFRGASVFHWPLSIDEDNTQQSSRDTGPQFPATHSSANPRPVPISPNVPSPIFSRFDSGSVSGDSSRPIRSSWGSQRRPTSWTSVTRLTEERNHGDRFNSLDVDRLADTREGFSMVDDDADLWRSQTVINRDITESEAESPSSREEGFSSFFAAERARPRLREGLSRLRRASPPPRVPFSLPTPDFSPIFDPVSESMETTSSLSPPQPDVNYSIPHWFSPHPIQATLPQHSSSTRSSTSHVPAQNQYSIPPWLPPHPIQATLSQHSSSTRSSTSHVPTQNQASTYRNIDLNAYHDGSFRASLQRFIELDRVRSRLSRLETMANEVASSPSVPPSLPPLRFDYDFLPFDGGPSQAEAAPILTSTQQRYQSRINAELEMGRSTDGRRARMAGLDPDERLRERLRRRASHVDLNSSQHASIHPATYPRPPDPEMMRDQRDIQSMLSGVPRIRPSRLGREEPTSRGQVIEFDPVMNVIRRDAFSNTRQQQPTDRPRRETSQETRRSAHWADIDGDIEGLRPAPSRRRHLRRGQETARVDRFPLVESSAIRPNPGAFSTRRRPSSQSPSRDDGGVHERSTRARFRTMRFRLNQDGESSMFDMNFRRRSRAFGDYMRDEDFDPSYESLLSLAATLGEVKPRAVPEHVLASLPTGFYKDWASSESDKRCPICLDDYKYLDPVMRLSECAHWLHKECLEQWLRGASTCPVCRKRVKDPRQSNERGEEPGPSGHHHADEEDEGDGRGPSLFINYLDL